MKFNLKEAEPSQESLFWIAVGAIGAYIGVSALINHIKNIKEQKNPSLIIDNNFGKLQYANDKLEYPLNTKENPIVIDQKCLDDYIDLLSDTDGWYHPSKSKFIPCQTLTYWNKHYSSVIQFVTGFAKLVNSKQVDKDVQSLSDRLFGQNAFLGNKTRMASSTSRFRWFPSISDAKNGYDPQGLLGFPNEWSNDIGYKKGYAINALRQKVVDAVKTLKSPIEEALKTDGKTEEQLAESLKYLKMSIVVLDSIRHDLNSFDYDADEYDYAIGVITGGF